MTNTARPIPLDRPPPEALSPAHGWLAYRQFPVFSWAWWWRRTLI